MTEESKAPAPSSSLSRKVVWFAFLYVAGVVAVGAVSLLIRMLVLSAVR